MLNIDFVTDYVCPYCLVAKEALEQAVLELHLRRDVKVTYHPFELTPPEKEGVDTVNDPVRRAKYTVLEVPAEELGINMKLPPQIVPRPHTRLAFEAWLYACEHDRGSLWSASMYHAYFVDELDIGDKDVLCHIARSLLLNTDDLRAAWDEGRYTARLLEMERDAKEKFQPRGVPTIYINGRYVKVKDYTKDEMMYRLMEAMQEQRRAESAPVQETEIETGAACGIHGCGDAGAACGAEGCN